MDAPKIRKLKPNDYTTGWLCVLPCEIAASRAILEALHADLRLKQIEL